MIRPPGDPSGRCFRCRKCGVQLDTGFCLRTRYLSDYGKWPRGCTIPLALPIQQKQITLLPRAIAPGVSGVHRRQETPCGGDQHTSFLRPLPGDRHVAGPEAAGRAAPARRESGGCRRRHCRWFLTEWRRAAPAATRRHVSLPVPSNLRMRIFAGIRGRTPARLPARVNGLPSPFRRRTRTAPYA